MMPTITSFPQLVEEIERVAEIWHNTEEGANFENYDEFAELEYGILEAIASYALFKEQDYNIGRFKLSQVYTYSIEKVDEPEYKDFPVLFGIRYELLATFVHNLALPGTVPTHDFINDVYEPYVNPDPELVAIARYFYASLWPETLDLFDRKPVYKGWRIKGEG